MSHREFPSAILIGLLLGSLVPHQFMAIAEPPSAEVVYYADTVIYPLPMIPEVLIGSAAPYVLVRSGPDASNWEAMISNEFVSCDLTLASSARGSNGVWNLSFLVPTPIRNGLYSLTINFTAGGKAVGIFEPNSIWVLNVPPQTLRLFAFSDLHSPLGAQYFYETFREMNLIGPDVAIMAGDLVDSPTIANGWKLLLGSLLTSKIPVYGAAGNHDYEGVGSAVTYSQIIGWLNYSIRIGDFLFVVLPTDSDGWVRSDHIHWAENVFKGSRSGFKALIFHHPIFGNAARDLSDGILRLKSMADLDTLIGSEYIYTSYRTHKEEVKQLLSLIIDQDVRTIISGHIHTDLNTILIDPNGKKHYFITLGTIGGSRSVSKGYKLLEFYANGSLNERMTFYEGTSFLSDPSSIPIELGQGTYPYKIGFLQYYFSYNDGEHHAVSFKAINELRQDFKNISIVLKLPKDRPLSSYRWYPAPPDTYEIVETQRNYFVLPKGVYLARNSSVSLTFASEQDSAPPVGAFRASYLNQSNWIVVSLDASDSGWGVARMEIEFTTDGRNWRPASLTDIVSYKDGSVTLAAWIPVSKQQVDAGANVTIRAGISDFAGNTGKAAMNIAKQSQPVQQPSIPFELIGIGVLVVLVLIVGAFVARRRISAQ